MTGLPLTNPSHKSLSQNEATATAINKKDPYADLGTMALSADKRARGKGSPTNAAIRSFLVEHKNGTIVSLGEGKGLNEGAKNPYSEMGFAIDFPDKKSKPMNAEKGGDPTPKVSALAQRRMMKNNGDPYSDVGSSLNDGKDRASKKATALEGTHEKTDLSDITTNLQKLIEKAQEISSKASMAPTVPAVEKISKIGAGNATILTKDPYADVGSISKKTTKALPGTKKDLNSLIATPKVEEFQNDSGLKSRTTQEMSGNSVTGVTLMKKLQKINELGEPQGYKRKDPYSDVGSAVDIKE